VANALTRGVAPETLAQLAKPVFYPVILVYLDWPDATVRAHSNVGLLDWNGHLWKGVGNFGALQMPEEEMGLASQPAEVRLIGAPDELDQYLDDPIRNREAVIHFGVVSERSGNVLVGEPFEIFAGYMDAMRETVEVEDGQMRRDVVITLANGPSQRSFAEVFHTYEDQIRRFPGDTAGRLTINAEAERDKLTWPE
jgi:hypothetical protein